MKILDKAKMLIAAMAVAVVPALALAPAANAVQFVCPDGQTYAEDLTGCSGLDSNENNQNNLMEIVSGIINVIVGVVGFVAVVVVILGGVQYTTSAGDAGKVKKAKDTIMYGIIGLVVAILAFAIVNFVLGAFVGK